MFKEYFILLLVGHVLGDFYLLPSKIFKKETKDVKKETEVKSFGRVLLDCLSYLGVMLLISLPIISREIALAAILAAILHFVIKVIKFAYSSFKIKKIKKDIKDIKDIKDKMQILDRNVFLVDQVLHFICLFGITYWVISGNVTINTWIIIKDFFDVVGVSKGLIISWILALLVIHKPANTIIQKLLKPYKPKSNEEDIDKDNNAGRFIGTVERIIMMILLSIGQYSAIGLVLTAKSIARYNKISEDKVFAEYYLLGTLISAAIVIVCAFII